MKGVASHTYHPPFLCTCYALSKPKTQRFYQVRSQSFKDEGSSSNMADANLSVLRARIDQAMKNEKLEYTTPKRTQNIGWNWPNNSTANYETQDKIYGDATIVTGAMEVMGIIGGSIGLVFFFGSLTILLVSVLVRLHS
ncbi:hypothetical protein R6Q57_022025 [Mikania cordata]